MQMCQSAIRQPQWVYSVNLRLDCSPACSTIYPHQPPFQRVADVHLYSEA